MTAGSLFLLAHCANLDPATPTARDRLDEALGPDLAHKLVFALSSGTQSRRALAQRPSGRVVFAA